MKRFRARRVIAAVVAMTLIGGTGCSRKVQATEDPKVREGYALIDKDPKAALAAFDAAKDPNSFAASYGKGLAHEALREIDQAVAAQSAAHQAFPQNPAPLVALARLELARGGELDAAWQYSKRAVELAPTDLQGVLLMTLSAHEKDQLNEVRGKLRSWPKAAKQIEARESAEASSEYYRALQFVELALRHRKEAWAAAQAAKKAKLSTAAATLTLAQMAHRIGKPRLAGWLIEDLARGVTLDTVKVEMAELALILGNAAAAKKLARMLPSSSDPRGYVARARSYLRTGDALGAVGEYHRALERLRPEAKGRVALRVELARALAQAEGMKAGIRELRSVIEQTPRMVPAHVLLARWESQSGEAERAVARLRAAVEAQPKEAALWDALGVTEFQRGHYVEAEQAFRKTTELAPRRGRPHRMLGEVLRAQKKPAEAEFRSAVEREPNDMQLRARLADYYLEQHQSKAALDVFREAKNTKLSPADLQLATAKLHLKLDQPDAAIAVLEEQLKKTPKHGASWLLLCRATEQAHPDKARAVLDRAVKQDPESPLLRAMLAQKLMSTGKTSDKEAAAKQYEELLEWSSGDAVALNNLASLYADELEQPERAVDLAERAFQLKPEVPEIADTLGWALYRRGKKSDMERARNLVALAAAEASTPTKRYHLGAIEFALEHREAAMAALEQALREHATPPLAEDARQDAERLLRKARALPTK